MSILSRTSILSCLVTGLLCASLEAQKASYSFYGKACRGRCRVLTKPIKYCVPKLEVVGLPRLGTTFRVKISGVLPESGLNIGWLLTGVSNSRYGPIRLPLYLPKVMAPGCLLLTSGEHVSRIPLYNKNHVDFHIPNSRALLGLKIYQQWVIYLALSPFQGMFFSQGGAGIIGT